MRTGKNGEEIWGQKNNLVNHLMSGSDIRFALDQETYIASTQSATKSGSENICVQALFHISKSGYNDFQSDAYWWFLNVCSSVTCTCHDGQLGPMFLDLKQKPHTI